MPAASAERPASDAGAGRAGRLAVISGPSGSGKSTICRILARDPRVWLSVSATTRPPRPGEVEGRHYHFLSREEFERRLAEGRFVEHAQVFSHYYGTPREPLEKALGEGRVALLDIDVQGARQIRGHYPEAVLVFVAPPSRRVLEERLKGRGTDGPEVIERRLAEADREMRQSRFYDHLVVNDRLEEAVAEIREILGLRGAGDDAPAEEPRRP